MKPATAESPSLWRRGLRWLERVFALIGLLFVVYHGIFNLSVISSASMAPTLQSDSVLNGDVILTEKVSYRFRSPRRWEVVLFLDEDSMQVMKRVVGLPGERISIDADNRTVRIDGEPVARPASLQQIRYFRYGNLYQGAEVSCGDGYFILGDDSKDSQDSRFIGPLEPHRIRGRPWLVVWPWDRFGFVNP